MVSQGRLPSSEILDHNLTILRVSRHPPARSEQLAYRLSTGAAAKARPEANAAKVRCLCYTVEEYPSNSCS